MSREQPAISGRLVRSCLRYLGERVGDAPLAALAREGVGADLLGRAVAREEWVPVEKWVRLLGEVERRWGDPATWRLVREMTRATMAAAISAVWGTFLADATALSLLERVGTFWSVSYDAGELRVIDRGPRRARLAVEGWRAPPPPVGVMVAEACAVFVARLGERAPRAVEHDGERLEVEVSW